MLILFAPAVAVLACLDPALEALLDAHGAVVAIVPEALIDPPAFERGTAAARRRLDELKEDP